jgi:DNA polymerase-3 subunit delta'
VAIIDGAERLLNEAANALLKTLEEPPPSSYLLLLSEAEELVLPTIVSRCQRLVLRPVSQPLIYEALVERLGGTTEQAALLADHASGRIGWAIEALSDPVLLNEADTRLIALIRLLDEGLTARLEAAANLEQQARNDPEATLALLAGWRSWWEGILRAKGGLSADGSRSELAGRLPWPSIIAAIRATDATRELWQNNVSPLLAFEHLTLAIPRLERV